MRGKPLNKDWAFHLGEVKAPHLIYTDDSSWDKVNIPHDYSILYDFDTEKGEACTGFLLGGIGWYRKKFKTTSDMVDGRVFINFDGIYCRSTIYLNGELVTFHPYGYSPLIIDVTDYLSDEGEVNLIAVKVDHTRHVDSRWYTGSGIYRKVSLHVLPKLHIPVWGTFFHTPVVRRDLASVCGEVRLNNTSDGNKVIDLRCKIIDPDGKMIDTKDILCCIKRRSDLSIKFEFEILNPILWEIHNGNIYKAQIQIIEKGDIIHEDTTNFGIRDFYFDAKKGFFFNGENILIKGVCLHHDGGLVGAAVPRDVLKRRLELLKELNCNAIRCAHNPFSEEFLDLCDEMGFLVQEEFYDEWENPKDKRRNKNEQVVDFVSRSYTEFFREYAKFDLQNVILRDRNHPSIFQWSIGNEIEWTYPKYNSISGYFEVDSDLHYSWNEPPNTVEQTKHNYNQIPKDFYDVGITAQKLSRWTKELDTTRPVTANCILPTVSYETGFIDALDVVGYSYRKVVYRYGIENYPDKPILGTENLAQWHDWKGVLDNEHISGFFIWTGIDHLGEGSAQDELLRKGSNVGLIDLAGFKKPAYHMFKGLWSEEPYIHMVTQTARDSVFEKINNELVGKSSYNWERTLWWWHDVNEFWNYNDNEDIIVEVYSNCPKVTLFCNDKAISTKCLDDFDDHIYKFNVKYKEGVIKAVGYKDNGVCETTITTAKDVCKIRLCADKEVTDTDLDSVVHVTAQLVDNNNNNVMHIDKEIKFRVLGSGNIVGVDNGHTDSLQNFNRDRVITNFGRCLMIVRAKDVGDIIISASCGDCKSNEIIVKVR